MKITGHQTALVFRHYDIGNVERLRDRLTRARAYARRPKVASLANRRKPKAPDGNGQRRRVTG